MCVLPLLQLLLFMHFFYQDNFKKKGKAKSK